jgi:hypothetical protein
MPPAPPGSRQPKRTEGPASGAFAPPFAPEWCGHGGTRPFQDGGEVTHLVKWSAGLASAAVIGLTLVVPATSAGAASASDPEFNARLHESPAFPNTRGHSEYGRTAAQREVEVTVNNAPGRIRGHLVTVFVNGRRIGTMRVNSAGHAEREWSTSRGQFVPWAGAGSPCRVRTASGTLVISGRYVRESGD